jgi:hypothetical protein
MMSIKDVRRQVVANRCKRSERLLIPGTPAATSFRRIVEV